MRVEIDSNMHYHLYVNINKSIKYFVWKWISWIKKTYNKLEQFVVGYVEFNKNYFTTIISRLLKPFDVKTFNI